MIGTVSSKWGRLVVWVGLHLPHYGCQAEVEDPTWRHRDLFFVWWCMFQCYWTRSSLTSLGQKWSLTWPEVESTLEWTKSTENRWLDRARCCWFGCLSARPNLYKNKKKEKKRTPSPLNPKLAFIKTPPPFFLIHFSMWLFGDFEFKNSFPDLKTITFVIAVFFFIIWDKILWLRGRRRSWHWAIAQLCP